jgi:hypothetical protein
MSSEGVSYGELFEPVPTEVIDKGNKTSKVTPENKSCLEKNTKGNFKEYKDNLSHPLSESSFKDPFSMRENRKGNTYEESKDDQKKYETSPKEYEESYTEKDKKSLEKEEGLEEEEISEPSKKVEQPPAQIDECYYSKLEHDDRFNLLESSYNLKTDDVYYGSEIRLALGKTIISIVKEDYYLTVTREDDTKFGGTEVKIVDAVILPPLEMIWKFWEGE